MKPDISNLDLETLKELQADIDKLLRERLGISIAKILSGARRKRAKKNGGQDAEVAS